MTGWLLDTNILSEMRRSLPQPRVVRFMAEHPIDQLYVSSVSLAEVRYGIGREADPVRQGLLANWLAHRIRPMFAQRVLAVTEDVMLRWRLMVEAGRKAGHTYPQPDLIIAATASWHGLTMVTRDVRPFSRAAVPVLNPWTDAW